MTNHLLNHGIRPVRHSPRIGSYWGRLPSPEHVVAWNRSPRGAHPSSRMYSRRVWRNLLVVLSSCSEGLPACSEGLPARRSLRCGLARVRRRGGHTPLVQSEKGDGRGGLSLVLRCLARLLTGAPRSLELVSTDSWSVSGSRPRFNVRRTANNSTSPFLMISCSPYNTYPGYVTSI